MTLISIRERGVITAGPVVSFDGGGEYPITASDPFSEQEEALLEWYFEEHLRFPFVKQVEAQAAAASITRYGEALFKQVFADPEAYARYKEGVQAGVGTLRFEIAGSPDFHRLHWEALKDPRLPRAFALEAPMVRKNLVPQPVRATVRPSPTINVLVVTARPGGARDVGYRTISRPLVEGLRQADVPVRIDILRPGTYPALLNYLEEVRDRFKDSDAPGGFYHVVHFDVHGALLTFDELQQAIEADRFLYQQRFGRADIAPYAGRKAFLFLEGAQDGQSDPVEAGELADLLITHQVPIAVLNACQSGKQVGASETSLGSRLMQAGVQMALAMGYSVTVSAAELLMQTLYAQLFAGQDLATAIRRARLELFNRKGRRVYFNQVLDLEDWLLPVAYQNRAVRLAGREFTPPERAAHFERQAARYPFPQPAYGFVGRDLDILHIERRLLREVDGAPRNLLLVRGMGGAGKTTLLHHLGARWQTTHFVDQVFYFGYDERAWTRQQIMADIARKLLGEAPYYATFQPLSLDAQQAMLAQRLRAHRHLLILDNLESITGAHLAIQNTLPPQEQAALRRFLADLSGGQTLILLGSRGGEDWLVGQVGNLPLRPDDIYDLPGLDPEAASTLADRILARHHATGYRTSPDFQRLLKLLDGYPLPLEVVLANLARQTPAEVLAALEAGDVALDRGDARSKTESILRCIDYSHSNLSPEAQGLLTCLAPFTAVLNVNELDRYTARLRQQPTLAGLPFDRWAEVLQEAANWGLLSPHPGLTGILHLQPIFPYFLRSRLNAPEQAEVRRAADTAFRQHYDALGDAIAGMLKSQKAGQRQMGQVLARLEYENLVTAVNLALAAQVSILNPTYALSLYLDATQDQRRGLELGQTVLAGLEKYPAESLAGPLGAEFVGVLDDIANRQLLLKQYAAAEVSYQKALSIWLGNKSFDGAKIRQGSASIYHQLGMVAQAQRQWGLAEQYYRQALAIYIEFNDRYEQAGTYHQLGRVAQEQRQWAPARDYFLQALETYVAYKDSHNLGIVLGSLARLWQASGDAGLPGAVAAVLGVTAREVEEMWEEPGSLG